MPINETVAANMHSRISLCRSNYGSQFLIGATVVLDAIRERRLFIQFYGYVKYTDVFEEERNTRLKNGLRAVTTTSICAAWMVLGIINASR
jgi:hypothetical protein